MVSFSKGEYTSIQNRINKLALPIQDADVTSDSDSSEDQQPEARKKPQKKTEFLLHVDELSKELNSNLDTVLIAVQTAGMKPGRENALVDLIQEHREMVANSFGKIKRSCIKEVKKTVKHHNRQMKEKECELKEVLVQLEHEYESMLEELTEKHVEDRRKLINEHEERLVVSKKEHEIEEKASQHKFLQWKKQYDQKMKICVKAYGEKIAIKSRKEMDSVVDKLEKEYTKCLTSQLSNASSLQESEENARRELKENNIKQCCMNQIAERNKKDLESYKSKMIQLQADTDHFESLYNNLLEAYQEQQEENSANVQALHHRLEAFAQQNRDNLLKMEEEKQSEVMKLHGRIKMTVDKQNTTISCLKAQLDMANNRAISAENLLQQLNVNIQSKSNSSS